MAREFGDSELFAKAAIAAAVGTPPVPTAVAEGLLEEALVWLPTADSKTRARVHRARRASGAPPRANLSASGHLEPRSAARDAARGLLSLRACARVVAEAATGATGTNPVADDIR